MLGCVILGLLLVNGIQIRIVIIRALVNFHTSGCWPQCLLAIASSSLPSRAYYYTDFLRHQFSAITDRQQVTLSAPRFTVFRVFLLEIYFYPVSPS